MRKIKKAIEKVKPAACPTAFRVIERRYLIQNATT